MDVFTPENIRIVILFAVPGFISMKVHDLRFAGDRRDLSRSLVDAIAYSCINLALLYWAVAAISREGFASAHPISYYVASVAILFLAPMIWPLLFMRIVRMAFVRNRVLMPFPKPWDFVFARRQPYWIILHMKDGRRIAGLFDNNAYASSYPAEEQIYLEQVWKLDDKGGFLAPVERSCGIIVHARDVDMVELFQ